MHRIHQGGMSGRDLFAKLFTKEPEKNISGFSDSDSEDDDHLQDSPEAKYLADAPSWTSITIKDDHRIRPLATMLFDSYIVIILNDFHTWDGFGMVMNPKIGFDSLLTLLAFDLRDNSVQETQIHDPSFFFEPLSKSVSLKLPYTLAKYGDNQILRYGVAKDKALPFSLLTIETFQPFTVKCENIKAEGPEKYNHTAQIYNDFLYILGGIDSFKGSIEQNQPTQNRPSGGLFAAGGIFASGGSPAQKRPAGGLFAAGGLFGGGNTEQRKREQLEKEEKAKNIWRFDIKNRIWEELKTRGEGPDIASTADKGSFLYGDNLYFYGLVRGISVLFALNLKSMSWTKITQKHLKFPSKENLKWKNIDQSIYQDTNSLRAFSINPVEPSSISLEHPIIYNNRLFLFHYIVMYILNLDEFGLQAEDTEEDKRFKSLFMNKEGSDITLKVQDKEIPAHKEVLIKRSKYFAALFNSGMSESRESVIEIQDCDSDVFQEFLRFLYTREVQLNEDLVMELAKLADKYVQKELGEKCLDFMKFTIRSDNVFKRLDFAFEHNLDQLSDFCKGFLKNNIDVKGLPDQIQYLEKLPKVKLAVINFIVNNFLKVYTEYEKNWSFYEDFLIKNVDMSTISLFVNFIYWKHSEKTETRGMFDWMSEEQQDKIMQHTLCLKQICFEFAKRNFKEMHQKGIANDLPNKFLVDLATSVIKKSTSNVQ